MNKPSFDHFFSHELNAQQQEAVSINNGALLVIAGAGSGKTRVITARIINLIMNHQIDPRTIIALTFTNKAAQEMRKRIELFIGSNVIKPFIGTFHAYCLHLLRTHAQLLERPNFTILDDDDQYQLITTLIKRNGLEKRISAKNLTYQLSTLKNTNALNKHDIPDPYMQQILQAYEHEKKISNCFDFDDLLLEVLKLYTRYPSFKEEHQQRIRHILIDEYQDTNGVQHALLKAMTLQHNAKTLAIDSVCAVGDEDQSIYSWRGATVENMLHFAKDFQNTKIIKIEQNYRSVTPILQVANHVIEHNKLRNPKKLWSERAASDRVRNLRCISGYQEGQAVAHLAKQLANKKKHSLAVLYRAHYQSRALEEALIRHSISYTIIGGIQFYERKEIKDILAYLRLIVNPYDRVSFFRVINCPHRGLGDKFQEEFQTLWDQHPFWTFLECCDFILTQNILPPTKATSLKSFADIFKNRTMYDTPQTTILDIINVVSYYAYLAHAYDKHEAEEKIENVKELIRATRFFQEVNITTIEQFLQEVALMQEKSDKHNQEEQPVKLMTLHAAKGLEFDIVILTGLEETVFPSSRSTHQETAIEEERRLFYVGITRAKEYLLLTHARYRHSFGSMTEQISSRFLQEIPEKSVHAQDASYWHDAQFQQFFAQWLGTAVHTHVLTFGNAEKENIKKIAALSQKNTQQGAWKKNQPVKHKLFGVGVIKEIDQKDEHTIFITAEFKQGIKKIKSSFLEMV